MADRFCVSCGKQIYKRKAESPKAFAIRKHCSDLCLNEKDNLFRHLARHRNRGDLYGEPDMYFDPVGGDDFFPTDEPPGSREKVEVLAQRVLDGQPLWHEADRVDFSGFKGIVVPRSE